jgi:hypothetical protein
MAERKPGEHRWALSWPGNPCLDCGLDDPFEDPDVLIPCGCQAGCEKCDGSSCVVDPGLKVEPCTWKGKQ